jgi:hypothetical protein
MASGFTSPLFPLGISAPSATQGGCRSLLAFWMGGACVAATPTPAPTDTGIQQGRPFHRRIVEGEYIVIGDGDWDEDVLQIIGLAHRHL